MFQLGYTLSRKLTSRRFSTLLDVVCYPRVCRCATFLGMLGYVGKRLVGHLVVLFVAVSLTYLLAASQLEPRVLFELRQPPMPPAVIDAQLARCNLSDTVPLLQRYASWLGGVFHGDWGCSPLGGAVSDQISARLWTSLQLVVIGTLGGIVGGVLVGGWAATRQYRLSDRIVTVLSLLVVSTPVFVVAYLSALGATGANQVTGWQVFEFIGESGRVGAYPLAGLVDRAQHLLLPTVVLIVVGAASLSRIQRALTLDAVNADYVRAAQARGLTRRQAMWRHAMRNAVVPTSTYVAFSVATMVVGATFVERVFAFPGLGQYVVDVITNRDVNGVVAVTALIGLCVVVGSLISDLLVAALDPRVRLQ